MTTFMGENFILFGKKWQVITSDKWILNTVAGYRLEFDQMPYQFSPPRPIKFSDAEHNLILKEIESILTRQIISEVTPSEGQYFFKHFFTCEKRRQFEFDCESKITK